jgi:hypothetical protein
MLFSLALFIEKKIEAGQKRVPQKQVRGVSIISLALNLAMLIVGAQYNSDEQCKLEVSQYIYIY